jgi:hypothetical protein
MKILFKSPEFSESKNDVNFQQALEAITAYKGVEMMTTHYLLELDNAMLDVGTIKQLFELFDQWKIDPSPLESFVQYVEAQAQKSSGTTH